MRLGNVDPSTRPSNPLGLQIGKHVKNRKKQQQTHQATRAVRWGTCHKSNVLQELHDTRTRFMRNTPGQCYTPFLVLPQNRTRPFLIPIHRSPNGYIKFRTVQNAKQTLYCCCSQFQSGTFRSTHPSERRASAKARAPLVTMSRTRAPGRRGYSGLRASTEPSLGPVTGPTASQPRQRSNSVVRERFSTGVFDDILVKARNHAKKGKETMS